MTKANNNAGGIYRLKIYTETPLWCNQSDITSYFCAMTACEVVPGCGSLRRRSFQAQSRICSSAEGAAFPGLTAYLHPHSWNITPQHTHTHTHHGQQLNHGFIVSSCSNKSKLVRPTRFPPPLLAWDLVGIHMRRQLCVYLMSGMNSCRWRENQYLLKHQHTIKSPMTNTFKHCDAWRGNF